MNKEMLVSLGLSAREAEAYFALLKMEDAPASVICTRTNESRTNTYDTLNSLIKKGLISYVIKNNVKYFMASSPKRLLDWMEMRKAELSEQEKAAEKLLPDLSKLRAPNEKKVNVEVYEGNKGVRSVLNEGLDECKRTKTDFLIFGALAHVLRERDPLFHKKYYARRVSMGIKTRYVFIEGVTPPKSGLAEYRFLPKEFKSFAATSIQGDEVAFWLETDPMVVILVKSDKFSETYRSNFEALWKMAKSKTS